MNDYLEQWGWSEDSHEPQSAYVHIPFCRHRCGYCNFSLLANRDDLIDRYLNAVRQELRALRQPRQVLTRFLGGGTPSLLSAKQLASLVEELDTWLPMHWNPESGTEFSIEANPLDITREFGEICQSLGVNRISIGGQSFQTEKLKFLERDHTPDQLLSAIVVAHQFFPHVSLDLIFGASNESLSEWKEDLQRAIDSGVQHLSTYGLTYEKGARFWGLREKGLLVPVSEDVELEMYEQAIDTLTDHGFEHYEVSNFAKPGHACRHNQSYWNGEGWWAFGTSAARYVGRTRSVNHRGTSEYMRRVEQGISTVVESEQLTTDQWIRERFVFGMRQMRGVEWETMKQQAPAETIASIENSLSRHLAKGWIERDHQRVRLTRRGLVVSDGLWSEYL